MKNKTWTKIAFYSILLGWFPFMFVCALGIWLDVEYRIIIVLSGLCISLFGSFMMSIILRDDVLFKSIDELEEEKMRYYEATQRLNEKIRKL